MPIALRMEVSIADAVRDVNGMAGRLGDLTPVNNRLGLRIAKDARRSLNNRVVQGFKISSKENLAKSINHIAGPDFVEVGSNKPHAAIQQVGGVIVPKHGKFLARPATRKVAGSGSWPRDFPPGALVFVRVMPITIAGRSWTGPALVTASSMKRARQAAKVKTTGRGKNKKRVKTTKRGRELQKKLADNILSKGIQFALIKSATIPPRPYLALENDTREWYETQIERFAVGER